MAKKPPAEPSGEDFDIEPTGDVQPAAAPEPPAFLLNADQVEAVRFYQSKPGYDFRQVETFVEQIAKTLRYLEQHIFGQEVAAHEKQEEIYYLQETISNLKATIEVFRAKGDPVVDAQGNYVTESQLASTDDVLALTAERDALIYALDLAQKDADRGWAAEAELRTYVDTTLAAWMQAQTEAAAHAEAQAGTPIPVQVEAAPVVAPVEPAVALPAAADEPEPATEDLEASDVEQAPGEAPASLFVEAPEVPDVFSPTVVFAAPAATAEPEAVEAEITNPEPTVEPAAAQDEGDYLDKLQQAVDALINGDDLDEPLEPTTPATPATQVAPFAAVSDDVDLDDEIEAPAKKEPKASKKQTPVARLASSPEAEALGEEAVIVPTLDDGAIPVEAPKAAGTPLPRLLRLAPEAAAEGIDPDTQE